VSRPAGNRELFSPAAKPEPEEGPTARRCRRCHLPYSRHRRAVKGRLGGFRALQCPDFKGVYR
jgi:hypothetical protein